MTTRTGPGPERRPPRTRPLASTPWKWPRPRLPPRPPVLPTRRRRSAADPDAASSKERLRRTGFHWLLGANTISYVGDGLLVVALPLIAASVTDDARLVTAVFALLRLPWVIAPILGAWSDRHARPAR